MIGGGGGYTSQTWKHPLLDSDEYEVITRGRAIQSPPPPLSVQIPAYICGYNPWIAVRRPCSAFYAVFFA